jgi:transcription initiation factor TFIID TATA-box-binding protein
MSALTATISIENVVAATELEQELDLDALGSDLDAEADYDPDHFPGLIYRLQDPQVTILMFRSGQIVCTGAQSEADIRTALSQLFGEVRALGIPAPETPSFEIQNMVAGADLEHRLNLNAIAIGLGLEYIEYEPEQFPGLVYRLDAPDAVVLLFGSGKLVITGTTTQDEIEQALATVNSRLTDLDLLG